MAKTRSDEDKDVNIDEDINRGIDFDEDIREAVIYVLAEFVR